MEERRQPPELVKTFLEHVLHDSHHSKSQVVKGLVWSFSQDLVQNVSRGMFLTAKHILMANAGKCNAWVHFTGLQQALSSISRPPTQPRQLNVRIDIGRHR